MKTRTETDTFGPIQVESDKYWGAQAQRSLMNFKIGEEKMPAPIVRALGIVKRAAAETNMELGILKPEIGQTVVKAAIIASICAGVCAAVTLQRIKLPPSGAAGGKIRLV